MMLACSMKNSLHGVAKTMSGLPSNESRILVHTCSKCNRSSTRASGGREFVDREAGKEITRPMRIDMVPDMYRTYTSTFQLVPRINAWHIEIMNRLLQNQLIVYWNRITPICKW